MPCNKKCIKKDKDGNCIEYEDSMSTDPETGAYIPDVVVGTQGHKQNSKIIG